MDDIKLRPLLRTAYKLYSEGKYLEAMGAFIVARDAGIYESNAYIGYMFANGQGVARDLEEAEAAYRQGAEHGDPQALHYMTELLRNQNRHEEAVQYYLQLHEMHNPSGAYWLYIFHRDGLGVDRDLVQSDKYLQEAALLGHAYGRRDLARAYLRGRFGRVQRLKGFWLFLKFFCKTFIDLQSRSKRSKVSILH